MTDQWQGKRWDVIYGPSGRAKEYADLACNPYKGCTHQCTYCFGAKGTRGMTPQEYWAEAHFKVNFPARMEKAVQKVSELPSVPPIHLSFIGDVYQPIEMELRYTRRAIELLVEYLLPFTVLTKGGIRACRDFDLLEEYPGCSFGTTLVFWNQEDADEWELDVPSIADRIQAIQEAHRRRIPTWVSLEPVIDPEQALTIIKELHPIVGHWKVGKLNYKKLDVDWIGFRGEVKALLESIGANYYLKKSLTELPNLNGAV